MTEPDNLATPAAHRKESKTLGQKLFKWSMVLHFSLGLLVLMAYRRNPANIDESATIGMLADFGARLFSVIDNAYLCKGQTRVAVALLTVSTLTAQLVLVAQFIRDWRSIFRVPSERIGYLTAARMILIGVFGLFMYYFTFFALGGEGTTPGYNVLCVQSPSTLWLIWTVQTFLTVFLAHLCWPFLITISLRWLKNAGILRTP